MRRIPCDTPAGSPRRGFTLVELMVSLVLFSVGLLGLAGMASLVAGMIGDGAQRTIAAREARSVLDSLLTVPCAALAAGSSLAGAVRVDWTIVDSGSARLVQQEATYITRRGSRTARATALLPCDLVAP